MKNSDQSSRSFGWPRLDTAAWALFVLGLGVLLQLKLLPALLGGLFVYACVDVLVPARKVAVPDSERPRLLAVILVALLVVVLMGLAAFGVGSLVRYGGENVPALMQRMAEIVEHSREGLPEWAVTYIPGDAEELRKTVVDWLREHVDLFQIAGAEFGRAFVHILIGMVIGALVSLERAKIRQAPLSAALARSSRRLGRAFRRVVFAQFSISGLNTLFTAVYLWLVLPACGIELPFTKTMVFITFVAGLLPIVGNLISNSVIFIVSLSQSMAVALGSLAYLVVIHKLEYFLNARIIGGQIRAHAWEILLAMVFMEAAFGIAGLISAPIYYAYLKDELKFRSLI
ncbi:MAG: putative PurR-regulated permease PerM [Gammaproteobacteria bacterium]|jgi:predicted PurR-regulated permease PerM